MSIRASVNDIKEFSVIEIRPMPRSKVIEHPVEDGSVVADNKVIEPLKVQVRGYVSRDKFKYVYGRLKEIYESRSGTYTWHVTSRFPTGADGKEYDNLVLTAFPHRESPDHLDCTEFTLEFTQIMLASSQTKVSDPSNAPRKSV